MPTSSRSTSRTCRPDPTKAREFGLVALARAIDGVTGTVAVHICFGYAAIIHERPEGYSFLPELAGSAVDQISIETAQSNLDTSVLTSLPGKTVILGVLDLSDPEVESADVVAGADPPCPAVRVRRPVGRRARLRPEVPAP